MQKPRAGHFSLTIANQIFVFGGEEDCSIECLDEVKGGWTLEGKLLEKRLLVFPPENSGWRANSANFYLAFYGQ